MHYRGAVRPPFIEGTEMRNRMTDPEFYRGAVRPPFIEGISSSMRIRSSKRYRGAVRPPFIEGCLSSPTPCIITTIGGQSAPPSLKETGY